MSESSITVVRVDWVSAKQIAHIGAAVTGWLLGTGVIAVNNRFDELWQPGAWMPGPPCGRFWPICRGPIT